MPDHVTAVARSLRYGIQTVVSFTVKTLYHHKKFPSFPSSLSNAQERVFIYISGTYEKGIV